MSATSSLLHPLFRFWPDLNSRIRFKFILPKVKFADLEGIKLDVSKLSPLMKNNILLGRYEVQERQMAQSALGPDDVVLELGGAIGFIGLFCKTVIGVKRHRSVEANPATLEILRRNYLLNGLDPDVVHAAAAAEDGEIKLHIGGEFWENSVIGEGLPQQTVTVPAFSLQSLVQEMPEPPTALICDIEGAEIYLDFGQLPPSVAAIIIELHPHLTGEESAQSILERLHGLGFRVGEESGGTYLLRRQRDN